MTLKLNLMNQSQSSLMKLYTKLQNKLNLMVKIKNYLILQNKLSINKISLRR